MHKGEMLMSHVSKIELEIRSLQDLKTACRSLGLEFKEHQKTYAWFGRFMGDYPLPENITKEDLGKCDHAISVPGCRYEIGVLKKDQNYHLLWDFWQEGGLEEVLGKDAGKLKQAYACARIKREAVSKNLHVTEKRMDKAIRLQLSIP